MRDPKAKPSSLEDFQKYEQQQKAHQARVPLDQEVTGTSIRQS